MIPDETREFYSKKERLIKTKDFGKVHKEGRSFRAGFIILKTMPNGGSMSRLGFSISARSIKRAFRRNRVKRLFREAYRRNKRLLKKGFDIVLVVRRDVKPNFSYKDAKQALLNLSKQAGILL